MPKKDERSKEKAEGLKDGPANRGEGFFGGLRALIAFVIRFAAVPSAPQPVLSELLA